MNTKFYLILLVCFFFYTGVSYAQTGIGTNTPHASAQLDVTSTDKGILIPRMTEEDRDDIMSPAEGLLIYQTNGTEGFYFYDGSIWKPLTSPGSTGQGGAGAIIPFASGTPVVLTTTVGMPETGAVVGFGSSASDVSLSSGQIDLTGAAGNPWNMAFVVLRDGIITDLSVVFSTTVALFLPPGTLSITAELYSNISGSGNLFIPIPGAEVSLSPLEGFVGLGTVVSGQTTGLSIPVTAGNRLMMVFSMTETGAGLSNTIAGYASGGLVIK